MPSASNTVLFLLGLLAIGPQVADAANFFSRAGGGNWGTNATWSSTGCPGGASAGATPGAGDAVTICAGDSVTMNGNPGAANSLTVSGIATWGQARTTSVGAGGVIVNAGGDIAGGAAGVLTSTGGLTINAVTTSTAVTVTLQTTAGQSISGTGSLGNLAVNATATNSGTLTVTTALSGTSTLTNTGTLSIGGTSAITGLAANTAANTINYTGAAQTVNQTTVTTYSTLGLSGSGAKTMTGITSITGNLNVSGTATMTGNAAFTVTGLLSYVSTAGTTTLTAATPISIGRFSQTGAGGTLNDNGNTITVTGTGASTWTKTAGTFTATGTAIFTGAASQIGASNFNNLTINVGSGNTATLTGTVTPAGNLTVSTGTFDWSTFNAARTAAGGTLTVSNGAALKIGGANIPNPNNSNYTTHTLGATSTVEYSGTTQNVFNVAAPGYGNLILSGSATKTAIGAFTVRGNLTIGSGVTFAGQTFAVTVNGDVSNSGTHTATAGTGTITLSGGAAAHTLSGAGTYANLVMSDANGATLSGASPTVSSVLTLTSGVITTGANTLITSNTCIGGASITRTSGHINGNLQLRYGSTGAQSCTFHVGDSASANYTPATVSFTNVSGAGSLIGAVASPGYSDTGYPLDSAHDVNRYWTLRLPGVGAITFTGSYSTAFTYLAADNDTGNTVSAYAIAKGDSCSPNCTWALQTVSGTPTTTTATASGITALSTSSSILSIGRRRVANFLVGVPASPFSTCNAAAITITARDSSNNTATDYTSTINITTATSDGDWSLTTGSGTLANGTADDGAATYAFASADAGVVALSLSNILVNSDVTITAVDNADAGTSTSSSAIQYRGNQFVIANDSVQVAGKAQTMTITRQRGASCASTLTEYVNNHALKAWYTADTDHPAGATAPAITGASPAITTAVPGANNLTLNFTAGAAGFTLTTTDVGKYVINVRDDASGNVDGTSPTITTRPFVLVVTGIKQGTTPNPSGIATGGAKFVAAGSSFEATIGGYLWNSAADLNSDGTPDGSATVAQITASGVAPRFAWATTLAAAAPITPAGTLGTLNNGSVTSAAYSGGSATPATLNYNEVGSFTLTVSAASYLNTGTANFNAGNGNAIVTDSSGGRTGVIGRVFPDHFTLLSGSSITPGCGTFTYEGQAAFGYSFTVEARNLSNVKTNNYRSADYSVGSVSLLAENSDSGTNLSTRLSGPSGSWSSGSYSFSTATDTFARATSPDGPFDALQIGVQVNDNDGAVLSGRDMNPATSGACGGACTGVALASNATTKVRFGRLREQNALASSGAVVLPVPIELQYWDGTVFRTNIDDSCTTVASASVTLTPNLTGGSTSVLSVPITAGTGKGLIRLAAPGAANSGYVLVTPVLPAYLQGNWSGGNWDQNPTARGNWGVFSQPQSLIFQRENY